MMVFILQVRQIIMEELNLILEVLLLFFLKVATKFTTICLHSMF
jgi:hypothetical protein